jgi:hypothetical protein
MPEISRFFGIVIGMQYRDHPPPHVHVRYAEQEARIDLRTLRLLDGWLSPRSLGFVVEWMSLNRGALEENWQRARRSVPLIRIQPLA